MAHILSSQSSSSWTEAAATMLAHTSDSMRWTTPEVAQAIYTCVATMFTVFALDMVVHVIVARGELHATGLHALHAR